MAPPRVVTLTTDIGSAYAAQMKARLIERVPPGHIVDIAHDLPAHRIEEAAFLLEHIGAAFPRGTVHVAVVDPGVGGGRAPIAIHCRGGTTLVGPDNGVLAPLARRLGGARAVRLDPSRIVATGAPSATFEGRDLFAPAAALIATGTPVNRLGTPWRFLRLKLPAPRRSATGVVGEVVHVDHFGNAITNIPTPWWPEIGGTVRVRLGPARRTLARRRTYSELSRREPGLIGSSFGTLEIAVREDRASDRLRLDLGTKVALESAAPRSRGPTSATPARAASGARARPRRPRREYGK